MTNSIIDKHPRAKAVDYKPLSPFVLILHDICRNDLRRLEDNRWLKLFDKVMLNFKAKETKIFFRIKDQIDFPCSFIRASIERISKDPFRYARFSMFR